MMHAKKKGVEPISMHCVNFNQGCKYPAYNSPAYSTTGCSNTLMTVPPVEALFDISEHLKVC